MGGFPLSQTLMSLIGFLIAVGLMVIVHEWGNFIAARKLGVQILRFSVGFGPVLFRWKDSQGTEYALSALPLGGYVKPLEEPLAGIKLAHSKDRSLSGQPVWRRMMILFAGPFANLLFACFSLWLLFVTGFPSAAPGVASVSPIERVRAHSPAEKSGLRKGDLIRLADQKPIEALQDFVHYVQSKPEQVILIEVLRGSETLQIRVVPEAVVDRPSGQKVGVIGVHFLPPPLQFSRLGPLDALTRAVSATAQQSLFTLQMMKQMLFRETNTRHLGGPLTLAEQAGQGLTVGLWGFLSFLSVASTSVALFYLLPIPLLDGGQLLYCLIEGIQRRSLSLKTRLIGQWVGGFFLILLMGLAFYNDFERFGLL